MIDFVVPNENENDFILMARKLGYNSICFVYSLDKFRKLESAEIKVYSTVLEDKKLDKAQKADLVITKAGENARHLIESGKVDFIYGVEENPKRDFVHYRNSGLNHVLCNLMKEKDVGYLVDIKAITESRDPQFLGRVIQNIRLCLKFKVRVEFASFATSVFEMKGASDARSLLKVIS